MKITEVVANFPPYFGGIGNSCLAYSMELLRNGDDVEVYTSNYPKIDFTYPDNLKVNRLNCQFRYGNAPLTLGLFKIKKTDIVHLHYPFYFGAEIILALAKLRRVKYVVTYHMDMVGSGFQKNIIYLHKKIFLAALLRNAEKIFITSTDYANNSDITSIKKIDKKLCEIPIGVDLSRFKPRTKDTGLLKKSKIPENAPVVMFTGGLDKPHYFKGVPVLLEAFQKISLSSTHLLIVGDGELRSDYARLAKNLGISKRVHFAGRVSNEDLPSYYSLCDVFVLPSTDKGEAFGMVLLEAMASGKAVVVSDLPGVRSLVYKEANGLIVRPRDVDGLANALERLLRDPNEAVSFGQRSREIAEKKYSWKLIGQKLHRELLGVVDAS